MPSNTISYGLAAGVREQTSDTIELLTVPDNLGVVTASFIKYKRTELSTETVDDTIPTMVTGTIGVGTAATVGFEVRFSNTDFARRTVRQVSFGTT
jgi:hypothetical protein